MSQKKDYYSFQKRILERGLINHSRSPTQSKIKVSRSLTPNKPNLAEKIKSEFDAYVNPEIRTQESSKIYVKNESKQLNDISKNLFDSFEKSSDFMFAEKFEKDKDVHSSLVSSIANLTSLKKQLDQLYESVQTNKSNHGCALCGCSCKSKSEQNSILFNHKVPMIDLSGYKPKQCSSCKSLTLMHENSRKTICNYCEIADIKESNKRSNGLSLFIDLTKLEDKKIAEFGSPQKRSMCSVNLKVGSESSKMTLTQGSNILQIVIP